MPASGTIETHETVLRSERQQLHNHIRTIYNEVSLIHADLSITPQELYLVIDEALTNAMEHGNCLDPQKTVTVKTSVTEDSLELTISDQGQGFKPDEQSYNKTKALESNRGRGLFLISNFCTIVRNAVGNELRLSIRRSGDGH